MTQNKMNIMRKETIKSNSPNISCYVLYLDENGLKFFCVLLTNIINTINNKSNTIIY